MDKKPTDIAEDYLAGKIFTVAESKTVYVPRYNDKHKVVSFDKVPKDFYKHEDVEIENPAPETTQQAS